MHQFIKPRIIMGYISVSKLIFTSIAVTVAYRLYWEVTVGARRRAIAKQHGTAAPQKVRTWVPFLGLDIVWRNIQAFKEHRVLELFQEKLMSNRAHTVFEDVLGTTVFLTDDPENVKAILSTDFETWSIGAHRIKQFSEFLGIGIFTNEGPAWKHSRSMLRPCFERSQVADISILHKHMERFIELLPTDGMTVDLQPLFHEISLDIASDFLFGRSTNSLQRGEDNKECEAFVQAFEYCVNLNQEKMETSSVAWLFLTGFFPNPKFKRSVKQIQSFADKLVDEEMAAKRTNRNDASSERYVFLDQLIAQTSDRNTIRSELLNILAAGRDTTAALLSNVLWEISRLPHVMDRIREEIAKHLDDVAAVPSYEQLKEMRYLKAVLSESQRLYPVVPANIRQALHDTTIPRGGGADGTSSVLVTKGSVVQFLPWCMHRRSDIFGDDALEFRPERWLDSEHPLRPGWGYLPFGGGPRVCIGQNFALTEAMFVVVRLLQCFKIESRDDEPWREKLSVTCTCLGGCKVALKKRH
jgi:cytochrome P450